MVLAYASFILSKSLSLSIRRCCTNFHLNQLSVHVYRLSTMNNLPCVPNIKRIRYCLRVFAFAYPRKTRLFIKLFSTTLQKMLIRIILISQNLLIRLSISFLVNSICLFLFFLNVRSNDLTCQTVEAHRSCLLIWYTALRFCEYQMIPATSSDSAL